MTLKPVIIRSSPAQSNIFAALKPFDVNILFFSISGVDRNSLPRGGQPTIRQKISRKPQGNGENSAEMEGASKIWPRLRGHPEFSRDGGGVQSSAEMEGRPKFGRDGGGIQNLAKMEGASRIQPRWRGCPKFGRDGRGVQKSAKMEGASKFFLCTSVRAFWSWVKFVK